MDRVAMLLAEATVRQRCRGCGVCELNLKGISMKHRLLAVVAVFVLALTVTTSAFAFDCIRVSSSLQGLRQSTQTGNWTLFDFSSAAGVQSTLANIGQTVTPEQAACAAAAYAQSGQPRYFALGTGVAGGKKDSTSSQGARAQAGEFGVIAWHNPNDSVLANGHGIDHLDDSPILGALADAAGACGIPFS
jgi:hypothetical protein